MANLDQLTFEGKFNHSSTGLFKDNTGKEIGADDSRALVTDIKDSFANRTDDKFNQFRGSHDLTTEAYPSTGGSGASSALRSGDWWYGINSGDFDVEDLGTITLNRGALLIYIGGTVSSASSWIVKQ